MIQRPRRALTIPTRFVIIVSDSVADIVELIAFVVALMLELLERVSDERTEYVDD